MGNQPSWFSSNVQQVPGLIESTWRQFTAGLFEPDTASVRFALLKEPIIRYTRVAHGLSSPVAYADPGYGDESYMVDQVGYVYRYDRSLASQSDDVTVLPGKGTAYRVSGMDIVQPPLIDLTGAITPLNPLYDERGLLHMVFHTKKPGVFYLYYTVPPALPNQSNNCDVVLEEWILSSGSAAPMRTILRWPHPEANHFGSPIGIGCDGLLYLATGDGGGAGDRHGPIGNAQNPESRWGKTYQIDVDSVIPIIRQYSLGHRNPWRGSFTHDGLPVLGDVGQDRWEGITLDRFGDNHGWRALENGHVFDEELLEEMIAEGIDFAPPLLWYGRALGKAVIGGYQLNNSDDYIFGDCFGGKYGDNVYLLRNDVLLIQPKPEPGRPKYLRSFGKGRDGTIYGLFSHTLETKSSGGALYEIQVAD